MSASTLSNQISAILKANNCSDAAHAPLVALLGADKSSLINTMILCAQSVHAGGTKGGVPVNSEAHTAYCDAFNDLCGYPDEYKVAMQSRLREGASVDAIAHDYGWTPIRASRFLNGDRKQYFKV